MTQKQKLQAALRACTREGFYHSTEAADAFDSAEECNAMFREMLRQRLILGEMMVDGGVAFISIEPKGRAMLNDEISTPFDAPAPTLQTFNVSGISGGNVQIGNHNNQHIDARVLSIVEAISQSEGMTADEKRSAMTGLRGWLTSPGLGNVIAGVDLALEHLDKLIQ